MTARRIPRRSAWSIRISHERSCSRVIRRPNGGTTAARNTGIDAATGTYVALLDHDDLWFPWTLQIQRQAIEQSGGPAFCAGQVILQDSSQAKDRDVPCPGLRMRRYSDFLAAPAEDCPYYPSGWVISAAFLRSVGGFFPYNRGYEDLDLLLRMGTASGYVRIWEPALSVRGLHEANLSSDKHLAWFVDGLKVLLYASTAENILATPLVLRSGET